MSDGRRGCAAVLTTGVLMTALAGCSHTTSDVQVEVTARLSLCHGANCVSVPAAGASVEVLRDGQVVRSGVADDAGRFVVRDRAAGSYSATATMPLFGLSVRTPAVEVAPGGAASLDANFQPALEASLKK